MNSTDYSIFISRALMLRTISVTYSKKRFNKHSLNIALFKDNRLEQSNI